MTKSVESFIVKLHTTKPWTAARTAAQQFSDKHFGGSDGGACGFAWVNVYQVRSNSKMGKALSEVGFRKGYSGVCNCGISGGQARVLTQQSMGPQLTPQ
jgi:hypothetical protein